MKKYFYNKYRQYKLGYDVLNKWMLCDVYDRKIEDIFIQHGIEKIAIYGVSDLGILLLRKLAQSKIQIKGFVDKYSMYDYYNIDEIKIYKLDEWNQIQDIDAIITTVLNREKQIEKELKELGVTIPIIYLPDLIMRM